MRLTIAVEQTYRRTYVVEARDRAEARQLGPEDWEDNGDRAELIDSQVLDVTGDEDAVDAMQSWRDRQAAS